MLKAEAEAMTAFAQTPCSWEVDIQNTARLGKMLLNSLLCDVVCYSSNIQTVTSAKSGLRSVQGDVRGCMSLAGRGPATFTCRTDADGLSGRKQALKLTDWKTQTQRIT